MSNKEVADITYKMLQRRKKEKARRRERDVMSIININVDRVYKKNYKGTKRRGQI